MLGKVRVGRIENRYHFFERFGFTGIFMHCGLLLNNITLMKQVLLIAFLFSKIICCYAQSDKANAISFNGFYIAKTGNIAAAKVDIHTYFRFYKDGTVFLQAVTANDPQAVSVWFGRFKKFSQKGTYQVNGTSISIQLNNKDSKDFQLEGLQETTFKGTIVTGNQLCLTRDNESKQNCFDFSKVSDTTKLKYSQSKPEIKLPGEWKIKQILKSNGQVFFTNEDSTIVAIAVFKASLTGLSVPHWLKCSPNQHIIYKRKVFEIT